MDHRELAIAIGRAPLSDVDGAFERHVSHRWEARAFAGSSSGGRWGAPGAFPVIYLGRPRSAVVVEAYRHLVDPVEGMTGDLVKGRVLLGADVTVHSILDLRTDAAMLQVGLTREDIVSEVGDYDECQRVGHVAHQLGLHGVIAPAASGLGETLALFPRHLAPSELPIQTYREEWSALPSDPRRLRVISDAEASGH